jgi:hypothetical protein
MRVQLGVRVGGGGSGDTSAKGTPRKGSAIDVRCACLNRADVRPTTWGAAPYRDQVIDRDAMAIAKLRRAGAVLAAKLAMVELAGGGGYRYASASLHGPGLDPWDTGRWSGGSSSGSGGTSPQGAPRTRPCASVHQRRSSGCAPGGGS